MGSWGTGIFSDDTAADVRDMFVELIGDGLAGTEATDRIIYAYRDAIADADEQTVFWVALALTQHRLGRLQDGVRRRAIDLIDSGADLSRWDEVGLARKRQAVLEKARATLESPQPLPKKVPKQFRDTCEWMPSQIVAYKLRSGRFCAFRVIGFHVDRGGKGPVVELLDWTGDQLPTARELKRARVSMPRNHDYSGQFLLGATSERELPTDRVFALDILGKPSQGLGGYSCVLWRSLDSVLETAWGLT